MKRFGSGCPNTGLSDPSWELIDPNPDIHALFIHFGQIYFGNQLTSVQVEWSKRMTSCAGICYFSPNSGHCVIRLSEPLLKLRPRRDLVETLLHEMIHALLFVTSHNTDREGHGPEFQQHMRRINTEAGTNITIYHTFNDEVESYKVHAWQCFGPCHNVPPFFGQVHRSMNRAPSRNDHWWSRHAATCGGTFVKVSGPKTQAELKAEKKAKKKTQKENIGKYFSVLVTGNPPKAGFPLVDADVNASGDNLATKRIKLLGEVGDAASDSGEVNNNKEMKSDGYLWPGTGMKLGTATGVIPVKKLVRPDAPPVPYFTEPLATGVIPLKKCVQPDKVPVPYLATGVIRLKERVQSDTAPVPNSSEPLVTGLIPLKKCIQPDKVPIPYFSELLATGVIRLKKRAQSDTAPVPNSSEPLATGVIPLRKCVQPDKVPVPDFSELSATGVIRLKKCVQSDTAAIPHFSEQSVTGVFPMTKYSQSQTVSVPCFPEKTATMTSGAWMAEELEELSLVDANCSSKYDKFVGCIVTYPKIAIREYFPEQPGMDPHPDVFCITTDMKLAAIKKHVDEFTKKPSVTGKSDYSRDVNFEAKLPFPHPVIGFKKDTHPKLAPNNYPEQLGFDTHPDISTATKQLAEIKRQIEMCANKPSASGKSGFSRDTNIQTKLLYAPSVNLNLALPSIDVDNDKLVTCQLCFREVRLGIINEHMDSDCQLMHSESIVEKARCIICNIRGNKKVITLHEVTCFEETLARNAALQSSQKATGTKLPHIEEIFIHDFDDEQTNVISIPDSPERAKTPPFAECPFCLYQIEFDKITDHMFHCGSREEA